MGDRYILIGIFLSLLMFDSFVLFLDAFFQFFLWITYAVVIYIVFKSVDNSISILIGPGALPQDAFGDESGVKKRRVVDISNSNEKVVFFSYFKYVVVLYTLLGDACFVQRLL